MPLPDSPRVIYAKNPLDEVICQLRFPPILRIDSEIPAVFQEAIRGEYPLLQEQDVLGQPGIPDQISKLLGNIINRGTRTYNFISVDQLWQVSLTRDFLALTCKRYTRWEEFRAHLRLPLEALVAEYRPAYYSRVGLRYRDVIVRSKLDLANSSWSELLQPQIAAELSSAIADRIQDVTRVFLLQLDEYAGKLNVQHGTASSEVKEQCYFIDGDYFTENRTEIANANETLDYFNRQAGRLFRWCITDQLHRAMEPTPVA